jgi:glutamate racemase
MERPIGVFDSGLGGLSVLRAIRAELPIEDLIYVADSGSAPYGARDEEFVAERATILTRFLIEQGVKAVVVACNTATSIAVATLRGRFDIPIVAIEPAVKPAATKTRSRVVGVLATAGTLSSPNMAKLLAHYGPDVRFLVQPCPGLADQVDKGQLDSDETRSMVERYVRPLVDRGADVLVLGCTHYPFVRPLVQEVAGSDVEVIDPATAVARQLRRRLEAGKLLRGVPAAGSEKFWTTGAVDAVTPIVRQLWGKPVEVFAL